MTPQTASSPESGLANATQNGARRPYYPRYAKDELASELRILPPEARCLANDLRDWSWAHGGVEDSEDVLFAIAKTFGFSKYRFRKFFPLVKNFFTPRDGFLFWSEDEGYRAKVIDISTKRRIAGKLGGITKSKKAQLEASGQEVLPLANATCLPDKPPPSSPAFATTTPPPPETEPVVSNRETAGGGEEVEKIISNGNGMDQGAEDQRVLSEHCHQLGLPAPSRTLTVVLRAKFPELAIDQVIQRLPRFDGQTGPGLWRGMSREQLEREVERQKNSVPKKKMSSMDVVRAQYAAEAAKGG